MADGKKLEFVEGSVTIQWENSLEKLKVLGYETSFVRKQHRKPFDRVYFTLPAKNLSNQFDDFVQLCSWLIDEITQSGVLLRHEEYDDPGTIANKLLLALRQVGLNASFPVQKLRTPYGEIICEVLDFLTDKALETKQFQWQKPDFGHLNQLDEIGDNDDNDDESSDIEDNLSISENDDADLVSRSSLHLNFITSEVNRSIVEQTKETKVSQVATRSSVVHINEWKLECERVAPKLRSSQRRINSEWRQRVDQASDSASKVDSVLSLSQADLTSLSKSLTDDLSRLTRRESHLNQQFPAASHQYKDIKVRLDDFMHKAKVSSDTINALTTELAELEEQIEDPKTMLENSGEFGGHDTSPLLRIKAALKQLKSEVSDFDLHIGVVSHSLLTAKHDSIKTSRAQMMKKNRLKNRKANNKPNDLSQVFD